MTKATKALIQTDWQRSTCIMVVVSYAATMAAMNGLRIHPRMLQILRISTLVAVLCDQIAIQLNYFGIVQRAKVLTLTSSWISTVGVLIAFAVAWKNVRKQSESYDMNELQVKPM